MNFIKIKRENEENIKRLSSLATGIIREYYEPLLGKSQNEYMIEKFQSENAIKRQLEDNYNYYIINDDNDLGFLAFYPKDDYMYLSKFYIISGQRGKGLGKKTIEFVKKIAVENGLNSIVLNVNKYNDSIKIYEKLGFSIIRAEKNDIGCGYFMDDYVMQCKF